MTGSNQVLPTFVSTPLQNCLTDYYHSRNIHPERFACQHQSFCRSRAFQQDMTETKMSMVGSLYGRNYPCLVVLSLDPPNGRGGNCVTPEQRTIVHVSTQLQADDYRAKRPNVHWALTQIIVKDVLCLFGYIAQANAAVVTASYAGRPIENVTPYFAHVNVVKCSMNNPGHGQAARAVHDKCGKSYLKDELAILAPDVVITQGNAANSIVGELLASTQLAACELPFSQEVNIGDKTALWLPMRHPARQIAKIRSDWPFYVEAIRRLALYGSQQ